MVYLVVGAVLVALALGAWALLAAEPRALARYLRYGAVAALLVLALFFLATGRGIADLPIGGLILFLLRHWIARGLPGIARLGDWLKGTPHARTETRSGDGRSSASSARMTAEEAWQVLGLEPGASRDEIREAHRRLMMKLHPDLGGSTYLASKINAARDLLLDT